MKTCTQCGKCCIKYADGGLSATSEEIEYWRLERPDIYQYVKNGEIWADPETGEPLTACPWLMQDSEQKFYCQIYHDRPEDCRWYPVSIEEMIRDACEMLEKRDLLDLQHSQNKLDILMSDSRPALQKK